MDIPKPPQPPLPPKKPGGGGVPPPLPSGGRKPFVPPKPGADTALPSPGAPGIADLGGMLERIDERSQDMMDSKKMLENQLKRLEQKLHEEREKALLAAMRGKEEAALSSKVELSLKEMQEKMQGEKRERELEDAVRRSREECAALEEKLRNERETWMKTLQEQMTGKEQQDKELELFLSQKLSALEKKWHEKKNDLVARLRRKEEELSQQEAKHVAEVDKTAIAYERRMQEIQRDFEARLHEEKEKSLQRKRERDLLSENFNEKEQELITFKAQLALVHSRVKLEKEKLNQSWMEELRLKNEGIKAMKNQVAHFNAQNDKNMHDKIQEIEQRYSAEQKKLKAQMEEEHARHTDGETDLRIRLSEAEARQMKAEETISLLKKGDEAFDPMLLPDYKNRMQELVRERDTHERERQIWKNSLAEIEEKLKQQHQQWEHALSRERDKYSAFQSQIKEKESIIEAKEKELTSFKDTFWNERDNWSQIAVAKDDELQRVYEKVDAIAQTLQQKESQLWEGREKFAEIIKQKEVELINMLKEKDKVLLTEKNQSAETVRSKEDEIMRLKNDLSAGRFRMREQVEKEFKQVLAQTEKENQAWAENIRKQYEETAIAKERSLREELRSIQKRMMQDLEKLEREHQNEKAALQQQLVHKEKELIVAIKGAEEKYIQELQRLRGELQRKDHRLESVQREHAAKTPDQLPESLENKLNVKIQEIEQLQQHAQDAAFQHEKELSELNQKLHEELTALEQRFSNTQKPKTLLGKIWAYLNRTVVVISFRKVHRVSS